MVSGVTDIVPVYHDGQNIKFWIEDLENAILALYGEVNGARKKANLISAIGENGKIVIQNFSAAQKDTYDHLKAALLEHYKDAENVIVERHTFNTLYQDQNETIDSYVTRLRSQALKCKFKATVGEGDDQQEIDLTDEFIRDRLVAGLRDQTSRARLLRERNLTLTTALGLVKAIETANNHVKTLLTEKQVDKIRRQKPNQKNQSQKTPQINKNNSLKPKLNNYSNRSSNKCGRCGRSYHAKQQCPAFSVKRHTCDKKGHYSNMCRNKDVHDVELSAVQVNSDVLQYAGNSTDFTMSMMIKIHCLWDC